MLNELGKRMGKESEEFNIEFQNIKETKTFIITITEIKDTLEIIKSQLNETEAHQRIKRWSNVTTISTVEQ